MGNRKPSTSRRRSVRTPLMALLLAVLGATVATTEPSSAPDGHSPDIAMLVRHPEVRKLRAIHWKPFIPAKPALSPSGFRRPGFGLYPGESEAPALPEITVDSPAQNSRNQGNGRSDFPPARRETLASISRTPDSRVSLKEEMLALDDLDTGEYGGMAASGADGERDIQGFLHIPTVWGEQLRIPDNLKRSVSGLVEGVNRFSPVRTEASTHLYLSSEKIFRMPFLYITAGNAFELTPTERRTFAEYLMNGGFAFLDNGTPQYENGAAEASLRRMVRDALGSRAHFEPLPVSHPLYHCWFDFADGPPQGAEMLEMLSTATTGLCGGEAGTRTMRNPVFYLEGIFIGDQLVGVYSNKGYSVK